MAKNWLDEKARTSTRGLKKTGENEWFDPQSRALFEKKNGKLRMKVDPWDRAQHKRSMERFRYYEKKFGIDLSSEKQAENDRWNYYNKMVREFNEGKIVQPTTVQRRQQSWEKSAFRRERMYSKTNVKLQSQIEETKKVMLLRMMGKHGVYNGKAYDAMVEGIAKALGKDVKEVEDRIFPKMQQEKSTYENIDGYIDNGEVALTEWVEELIDNNEISSIDGDHALELFKQV